MVIFADNNYCPDEREAQEILGHFLHYSPEDIPHVVSASALVRSQVWSARSDVTMRSAVILDRMLLDLDDVSGSCAILGARAVVHCCCGEDEAAAELIRSLVSIVTM